MHTRVCVCPFYNILNTEVQTANIVTLEFVLNVLR